MSEETVYAVERWNWRWVGDGLIRLPGTTRVRTFDNFDGAEAFRSEREAAARDKINPFRCGGYGLHYWTSLDLPRLHDWMLDAGIEPPTLSRQPEEIHWPDWWQANAPTWPDHQRAKVWEALDKVRFFEVVPTPRRPTVFIVSQVHWIYNDSWYDARQEGGEPVKAFRNYASAEALLKELTEAARRQWEGRGLQHADRLRASYDPFGGEPPPEEGGVFVDAEEATFYEITEVELREVTGGSP